MDERPVGQDTNACSVVPAASLWREPWNRTGSCGPCDYGSAVRSRWSCGPRAGSCETGGGFRPLPPVGGWKRCGVGVGRRVDPRDRGWGSMDTPGGGWVRVGVRTGGGGGVFRSGNCRPGLGRLRTRECGGSRSRGIGLTGAENVDVGNATQFPCHTPHLYNQPLVALTFLHIYDTDVIPPGYRNH